MGSPASPERAAPGLRELTHPSPELPEADPDASRDARYANPFGPPDELEPDGEPAPRSLFGEILDWMLAPLLLLWPMSIAVTYLVAKSIANGPFDRALEKQVTVLAQQVKEQDGRLLMQVPNASRDNLRADDFDYTYYQLRDTQGE